MDTVLPKLRAACEYDHLSERTGTVSGYLLPLEGYMLMLLAAEGPGAGAIVEIGSFMGRSTTWLASGSMSTYREKVTAVDHFRGSPEHQEGAECETRELVEGGSTFPAFQDNLRRMEVEGYVDPIVASSEEAVKRWDRPIRLLFIDGDHSYEESRKDFELWSPFVVAGGIVAFHDVGNAPGVTKFYREMMQATQHYEQFVRIMSLAVVQKKAPGA